MTCRATRGLRRGPGSTRHNSELDITGVMWDVGMRPGRRMGVWRQRAAQLSLALLADALGNDEKAQQHYQDFKFKVVARLPHERWELSQEDIQQTVAALAAERGRDAINRFLEGAAPEPTGQS